MHRIGRTGRMGKDGVAFSFVTVEQGELLNAHRRLHQPADDGRQIEGFTCYTPRPTPANEPKQYAPVYGDRTRRYSRRL